MLSIYGKLAGDTTLRNMLGAPAGNYTNAIYHGQAPEDAGYPFVVFAKQAGTPTQAFGDPTALVEELWQVRAVDESDSADKAEVIAGRVVYLLDDASLSLSSDENTGQSRALSYLRRQSDVEYSELDGGKTYHHIGGIFRAVWS